MPTLSRTLEKTSWAASGRTPAAASPVDPIRAPMTTRPPIFPRCLLDVVDRERRLDLWLDDADTGDRCCTSSIARATCALS